MQFLDKTSPSVSSCGNIARFECLTGKYNVIGPQLKVFKNDERIWQHLADRFRSSTKLLYAYDDLTSSKQAV